jgi:hypothetical protein
MAVGQEDELMAIVDNFVEKAPLHLDQINEIKAENLCNFCWMKNPEESQQKGGRLNLTKLEAKNLLKQFKYPLNIHTNVQFGGNNGKVIGIKNNKLELSVNGNLVNISLHNIFVENKPIF